MKEGHLRDQLIVLLGTYGWARVLLELSILFEAQGVAAARGLAKMAIAVAQETREQDVEGDLSGRSRNLNPF